MRIFAIRGENLASLAGPFEVALDTDPLARHGLFAITGPVGAGKSTLLDALCLALFDRTPRLADRGGALVGPADDPTRLASLDVRGILRRGAGHGWAEVDFRGRSGRRLRARWSVRRARGRADGKFQAQTLELVDAADGTVLGGTKRETLDAIQRELGLTFEQFRRSVVLAQGEFAAFLRANSSERAALLERMTETGIYGALSIAAHRRAADARARITTLEGRLEATSVLDDDARAALDEECRTVERELARLQRDVDAFERRERLVRELTALDARIEQLGAKEREQAGLEVEAQRAADAARGERATLDAAARSRASELAAARALDQKIDQATADRARLAERVDRAARGLATAERALRHPRELVALGSEWADFVRERERFAKLSAEVVEAERSVENAVAARDRAARALGAARALEAELVAARDDEAVRREAERAAADAARLVAELAEAQARAKAAIAAARARVGLAEHRTHLVDGEPCPLCGSLEHPGVTDPDIDDAELKRLEDEHEHATSRVATAREQARGAAADAARAEREKRKEAWLEARDDVREGERDLRERDARLADLRSARDGTRTREAETRAALDEMLARRRQAVASERECQSELASSLEILAAERAGILDGRPVEAVEEENRTARAAADAAIEEANERFHAAAKSAAAARAERLGALERRADLAERLADEVATETDAEALRAELARIKATRDDLLVRRGVDDRARADRARLVRELEVARGRSAARLALGELIGSADGRKFRAFAQGLSFEHLLAHANRHLGELTPRYKLMRVPSENLDLQVLDRDLGDEIRSVHGLSGGETFLVSLALALGLASMSAKHAAFETLFIDEGLGMLDAQSLEIVLSALDALQATGYQVGVISHVEGLAERVGARVDLVARGGGRSDVRVIGGGPEASELVARAATHGDVMRTASAE